MPLINSQADGNVPARPGRAFYSVVGVDNTRLFHDGVIDANFPATTATPLTANLDPVVTAGLAQWGSTAGSTPLIHGGVFAFTNKAVIIEALTGVGVTWTINNANTFVPGTPAAIRATPASTPFRLAPGEWLVGTGGSAGASVVCRLDGERIL